MPPLGCREDEMRGQKVSAQQKLGVQGLPLAWLPPTCPPSVGVSLLRGEECLVVNGLR